MFIGEKLCFDRSVLFVYMSILVLIAFYLYVVMSASRRLLSVHEVQSQRALRENALLQEKIMRMYPTPAQNTTVRVENQQRGLAIKRIYDPLQAPERTHPDGSMRTVPTPDYQQVGYIFNSNVRLPLFGRRRYFRSDDWEYYVIDNSENKIKIPLRTHQNRELSNDSTVSLDGHVFTVKLYEYDTMRYDPDRY